MKAARTGHLTGAVRKSTGAPYARGCMGDGTLTTEQNASVADASDDAIKLLRAYGGCLGAKGR